MSAIPSIILSAVLSCGSVPADVQGVIDAVRGDNTNIVCVQDLHDLKAALEQFGVRLDTNDCDLGRIIEDYINGGCNSGEEMPDEPEAPDEPETPTDTPVVTQSPTKAPSVTKAPAPTKAPSATRAPAPTKAPSVTRAPAPTKAPSVTQPPTDNSTSSYARQVVDLVNQERTKRGLSALTIDNTLMSAAQTRAIETVKSFSHTRPNGSSFSSVLSEYGYSYRSAGENIAYGQRTPQEVVTAWMNSSGHRANILNGNYTKIGVGCYKSGSTYYWSQLFAG